MSRREAERWANCAAVYVRMSTEHQQYSTSNQMDVIREYAKRRGLEIVKEYSDEGKSGLNIQGRDSLAQMISDVQEGRAEFACILVYDVSRWGRFQDADESAYYEYVCRRAGVAVHYCAEQFENDGSPVSTIVKGVKRAMAGEYSRELSSKVFQGACRLVQLGFRQGGTAGFGLRRVLLDQSGAKKGELKMGEQKSIQTDRVVLVPGPEEEVATVQWIYQAFVNEGKIESEIAAALNGKGIKTDFGREWNRGTVHQVLTNEKYIGNNVYHRTSFKLKRKHVVNPPERWIRAERVFEGIVELEIYLRAREIILARSQKLSDEEMLEKLRALLKQHGRISGILIDEAEGLPSSTAFGHRFGTLLNAYRLIGYDPAIDYSFIEENRRLRKRHPEIVASVVQQISTLGGTAEWDEETQLLHVNHELRVGLGTEFNIIKFRTDELKVSFLSYPDFMALAHPALRHAVTVDLVTGKSRHTDYAANHNPPILHRKETFLPADDPRRPEFAALTRAEEDAGLFQQTATIGFKLNWERLLAAKGLRIEGHELVKLESGTPSTEGEAKPYPASGHFLPKAEKEVVVERHKTALMRYELSKPVKTLLEYGLLKPDTTFFDYGCGQGSDLRGLQALGHEAEGWDPVHRAQAGKREADIVNLGYVLIHRAIERGSEAFHLQDLSQKDRKLFVRAAFRQIGDVLEGVLLPHVRQVHALLLRVPGCPLKQNSDDSSFGSLISDLLVFPELQQVYRGVTSGLPIHQWRNVAQHSKYRYDNTLGKVVCRVGLGANETDALLSFDEFVRGLEAIGRICDLHKVAVALFAADNLEQLATRVKSDSLTLSDHTVAGSIITACHTEGFEVVSLRTEEIPWKLNLNVPNGKTRNDCERILKTVATYTSMRADLSLAFELHGPAGAKPLKGVIKKA